MRFLKNFFNIIDITRKVILNLLFILALLLLSITFFVRDVQEDPGPVITFAPKKINETTNSTISFFDGENYPLNLFEIISAIEIATSKEDIKVLFMDLTYLDISFTGILSSIDKNNLNLELSNMPAIPTTLFAGSPEYF